jgi:hypothetical protein
MEVGGLLTGRRWVALPFTDHCAPLYLDIEAQSSLIAGLLGLARERGIHALELRCGLPAHAALGSISGQVLHALPLSCDSESVAARFHSTHRRNIKAAQRRGVRIERVAQQKGLDAFYELHLQTRRRQGIPIQPRRFFDLLGDLVIGQGLGFVLLAYTDARCLAGAVLLHWQHTLTYKYGASAADGLELRPNNLLFWSAIRWGCENGYTVFDMGKTDPENSGLRTFKTGWGAIEVPLVYSATPPNSSGRNSGKLRPMMQTVIRNSPPWVCRAIGEALYRYAA